MKAEEVQQSACEMCGGVINFTPSDLTLFLYTGLCRKCLDEFQAKNGGKKDE